MAQLMESTGCPTAPPAPATEGSAKKRVLIVEDDDQDNQLLQHFQELDRNWEVARLGDVEEVVRQLEVCPPHLVITRLSPASSPGGMELLTRLSERHIPVTVFLTAAPDSVEQTVRVLRLGSSAFLDRPITTTSLRALVGPPLEGRPEGDSRTTEGTRSKGHACFNSILSQCPRMHAIFDLVANIADTMTTVLIEGETGTGKEQLARAIHAASVSRSGPLVALNCAALPETLLESELFGHEKGAFTGAANQRKGRFEIARGGTVFLDEVGDVPPMMQVKLLRVLQERKFERIGGSETLEADVRVIAATNRPLKQLVSKGIFREDLYYRLNVVRIEIPPLRERPGDIPLLAAHFAEKHARPGEPVKRFSPAAMKALMRHHWPGNVRELENVVERACVISHHEVIEPDSLPPELFGAIPQQGPFRVDLSRPLKELLAEVIADVEKRYILKALKKTHGHVGKAARICGYCRRSITAKIAEYNLDRSTFFED